MRASRLLAITLLLQARGRITAAELATRLEVSVRTIYRDLDALSAAGVPVFGTAGHDGGYRLVDGYRTSIPGLTGPEAEGLFLAGLPTAAADLGLGDALRAAQLKVTAALPADLRDRTDRMRARFHVDPASWYREPDSTPHLTTIAQATWNQERLELRYLRWRTPRDVTRVVDPHGVVLKAGQWYLVARDGDAFRTYRVSRIESVTAVEETFTRDDAFDIATYWAAYLDDFERRREPTRVTVRVTDVGRALLGDRLTTRGAREVLSRSPSGPGRWSEITLPLEGPESAVRDLLGLGAEVEVLGPPELRERLVAELRMTLHRYQELDDPTVVVATSPCCACHNAAR